MKKKFQTAVLLVLAATLLTIVAIGVYVLLLLADPDNVFTLILAAFILIEFTLILSALGIIHFLRTRLAANDKEEDKKDDLD